MTKITILQVTRNVVMHAAVLSTTATFFDDHNYATQHYEMTANGNGIHIALPFSAQEMLLQTVLQILTLMYFI